MREEQVVWLAFGVIPDDVGGQRKLLLDVRVYITRRIRFVSSENLVHASLEMGSVSLVVHE
jgi:hypothetical protein